MILIPVLAGGNASSTPSSTRVRIALPPSALSFAPCVWPDRITVRDVYIGKPVQLTIDLEMRMQIFRVL